MGSIDGIQLDRFERGHLYDVGELLGAVMITEGWAQLVASNDPAMLIPLHDIEAITVPEAVDNARRQRVRNKGSRRDQDGRRRASPRGSSER